MPHLSEFMAQVNKRPYNRKCKTCKTVGVKAFCSPECKEAFLTAKRVSGLYTASNSAQSAAAVCIATGDLIRRGYDVYAGTGDKATSLVAAKDGNALLISVRVGAVSESGTIQPTNRSSEPADPFFGAVVIATVAPEGIRYSPDDI